MFICILYIINIYDTYNRQQSGIKVLETYKSVPLQACSGPESSRKLRFPDFMTTAQDVGKVVNLKHRPPLPISVKRLSRPQGHSAIGRILCQWKFPVTPAGIEPATFRFVEQHLNHCATAVPLFNIYIYMCTSLLFMNATLSPRKFFYFLPVNIFVPKCSLPLSPTSCFTRNSINYEIVFLINRIYWTKFFLKTIVYFSIYCLT